MSVNDTIVKMILDDYLKNGSETVDGVRWPIKNEYSSSKLTDLLEFPQGGWERDKLHAAIKEAFEKHFPVQLILIARSVDVISVYPKMNSDRTPKSVRLS